MIKKAAIIGIAIPTVLALTFGIMTWSNYNTLVRSDNDVALKRASIVTALSQRNTLVVNLITVVDAYIDHESDIYESITSARAEFAAALASEAYADLLEADQLTSLAVTNLLAFAEDNPDIKAAILAEDLMSTMETQEVVLRNAREAYNISATEYNTNIQLFPRIMFAKMFGYDTPKPLWQMTTGEDITIDFPTP